MPVTCLAISPSLERKFAVLKAHCATVGRDYESIHRTAGTFCSIGETGSKLLWQRFPPHVRANFGDRVTTALIGSPETIRQRLQAYEDAGVQELIMRFFDMPQLEGIRLFAKEFIE